MLSSTFNLLENSHLGSEPRVSSLLKGVYNLRPLVPRYQSNWDPTVAVNFLKNSTNESLTLLWLSKKLAINLGIDYTDERGRAGLHFLNICKNYRRIGFLLTGQNAEGPARGTSPSKLGRRTGASVRSNASASTWIHEVLFAAAVIRLDCSSE